MSHSRTHHAATAEQFAHAAATRHSAHPTNRPEEGTPCAEGPGPRRCARCEHAARRAEHHGPQLPMSAKDVSAKKPGTDARILFENLPGHSDNLMCGQDGRMWVGLVKPRGAFIVSARPPFSACEPRTTRRRR